MSNAYQSIRFIIRPLFRPLIVTSVVFCFVQNTTVHWLYSHLPYKGYKCALTPPFVTTYRSNLQLSIDVHLRCSPSASGTYHWFVPRWPLHILNRGVNFIQSIHTTFTPSIGNIKMNISNVTVCVLLPSLGPGFDVLLLTTTVVILGLLLPSTKS